MVKINKRSQWHSRKKITTLVKAEILARTWRQKKWDQDVGADKTDKALSSVIQ